MYLKNKSNKINLRLSDEDLNFCKMIAEKTEKNVSIVIREIIEKERIRNGYQQTTIND